MRLLQIPNRLLKLLIPVSHRSQSSSSPVTILSKTGFREAELVQRSQNASLLCFCLANACRSLGGHRARQVCERPKVKGGEPVSFDSCDACFTPTSQQRAPTGTVCIDNVAIPVFRKVSIRNHEEILRYFDSLFSATSASLVAM